MPMLSASDSDWTLRAFYLMVLITLAVVGNLMYTEAQRKKNRGGLRVPRHTIQKRSAFQILMDDFSAILNGSHAGAVSGGSGEEDGGVGNSNDADHHHHQRPS